MSNDYFEENIDIEMHDVDIDVVRGITGKGYSFYVSIYIDAGREEDTWINLTISELEEIVKQAKRMKLNHKLLGVLENGSNDKR